MISRVAEMLSRCQRDDTVMPPTLLYNEGWMLRLVVDWFARHREVSHPLSFLPHARWYSEVLLPTQFTARERGDTLGEAYTHADAAIGHFRVGGRGKGDLVVDPGARQLVIAEAKMYSSLSPGTRRATSFDQAARNVACVAESLRLAGRPPAAFESLAFVVVAPEVQIRSGVFASLLSKASIEARVADRVNSYGGGKDSWYSEWFQPTLERIEISELSWESCVAYIEDADPTAGAEMGECLEQCLKWNRPSAAMAARMVAPQSHRITNAG